MASLSLNMASAIFSKFDIVLPLVRFSMRVQVLPHSRKVGLASGVRGAGAERLGFPSAVRGILGVVPSHCAESGRHSPNATRITAIFLTMVPPSRIHRAVNEVAAPDSHLLLR
jgi:hypothetical protein